MKKIIYSSLVLILLFLISPIYLNKNTFACSSVGLYCDNWLFCCTGLTCSSGWCVPDPTATPRPPTAVPPTATPAAGGGSCDTSCGICGFKQAGVCSTNNSCCHRTCSGSSCITVSGGGTNACDDSPQCTGGGATSTPSPTSLDAFTKICATRYSSQSGISNFSSINSTSAGCANHVGNIDIGDFVKYNTVNFGSGANKLDGRGSNWPSTGVNAKIEVYIDSISDANKKGTCNFPNPVSATSAAVQGWGDLPACNLTSTITGTHALFLKFIGSGDASFVWFKFSSAQDPTYIPTTAIPAPQETLTPVPGCLCNASSACTTECVFDKFTDATYINPIKCSLSDSLFPASPSDANKTLWCQKNRRTKGDADGDGVVLYSTDYLYYVAAVNGGKIPVTVNPDFNGDGEVGSSDRAIVYKSLNP